MVFGQWRRGLEQTVGCAHEAIADPYPGSLESLIGWGRPHWARFGAFLVALCRLVRIMTTIESTKPFNAPLFDLGAVGLYTHNTPNYTVIRANLGRIRWYRGRQEGGWGLPRRPWACHSKQGMVVLMDAREA